MGKIDHPDYYKAGGIEAIDVIEDWKLDFLPALAMRLSTLPELVKSLMM